MFGRCQKFPALDAYRYDVSPAGLQQLTAAAQQLARTGRRPGPRHVPAGPAARALGWCRATCSAGAPVGLSGDAESVSRWAWARGRASQSPLGARGGSRVLDDGGAADREGARGRSAAWRPAGNSSLETTSGAARAAVQTSRPCPSLSATCGHAVPSREAPVPYLLHGVLR